MINEKIIESKVRMDLYISQNIPDISRSYASQLIAQGRVLIDGSPVKASSKTIEGSMLQIDIPEPIQMDASPEDIPLDIVYEDKDLLVINKAQGMVVHPAPGHYSGTLVHALLHHCSGELSDMNGVIRPGIVHRIDKDTSGLMLAVKNNKIHEQIASMIAAHEIERHYRCLVHGVLDTEQGTIDAPIGRGSKDRKRMVVCEGGKPSISHFTVNERFEKATDLKVRLETGRTHQIRAHMTFINHPLLGDPLYAPKRPKYDLSGQALHSCSIAFIHPGTNEKMYFESDLPEYYKNTMQRFRSGEF